MDSAVLGIILSVYVALELDIMLKLLCSYNFDRLRMNLIFDKRELFGLSLLTCQFLVTVVVMLVD